MRKPCTECGLPSVARRLCHTHYEYRRRNGLVMPPTEPQFAPAVDRFWASVDRRGERECWEWTGHTVSGYGVLYIDGKSWKAHRYSYFLAHGECPAGLDVCHSCDNPPCVNPDHLFLGSEADNMRDMREKGRSARGERHPDAKLTNEAVTAMRVLRSAGRTVRSLAAEYGVEESVASRAIAGRTWRHI